MHCASYGARERRARSEMEEALPGFCRRTHMPVANRLSQAASYTRTWGHGDMISYSRKTKLSSRLVHRHALGYIGQSAWRIGVLQPNTRIATHRCCPCQYHRGSSFGKPTVPAAYSWSCEHAMSSVDRFGAVAISLEKTTRHLTRGRCMRVSSSRCPAVRAICQVSIPHVERSRIILILLDNQSEALQAPIASLFLRYKCSERTCGHTVMRQSFT